MSQLKNFNELSLPPGFNEALKTIGFERPTPVQAKAIPGALDGKDLLALAPTGTGKTGAYGIPSLSRLYAKPGKQLLVLAPTRELATQIFRFLRKFGERLGFYGSLLVGGESFARQDHECKDGVDFIVATPGRLMDHLNQGLNLANVEILVLDEFDRMLDMGFAPQVQTIVAKLPRQRQTLLFSATFPDGVLKVASKYLSAPITVDVLTKSSQPLKIQEEMVATTELEKLRLLVDKVGELGGKILIFANTQGRVEQVTRRLKNAGHLAVCIHAGRTNGERKLALGSFRRGEVRILVATDVVSRGIDVLDIAHVVNFDYPSTQEDYLHRIGRTGRMGKRGHAVTFVDETRKPQTKRARSSGEVAAKLGAPSPSKRVGGLRPYLASRPGFRYGDYRQRPVSLAKESSPKKASSRSQTGKSGTDHLYPLHAAESMPPGRSRKSNEKRSGARGWEARRPMTDKARTNKKSRPRDLDRPS